MFMKKPAGVMAGFLFLSLSMISPGGPASQAAQANVPGVRTAESIGIERDFGRMPLYFIPNRGQVEGLTGYYVQGRDKTIYFTPAGLTFVLMNGEGAGRWVTKLDFVGADPEAIPVGLDETGAIVSFFKGNPKDWNSGIPTYSKVVYEGLWPGIDLVYYGTVNRLKYEFVVHPGADPGSIRLAYRGATDLAVDEQGRLRIQTPEGGFEDDTPLAYQEVDGNKAGVSLAYELGDVAAEGNDGQRLNYGFNVGEYDRTRTLVLDPTVVIYCGYIGGSGDELSHGIIIDGAGNAYITGETSSTAATFPVAVGPDLTANGAGDAFVAKVNAAGTALVYCGFIGGAGDEESWGLDVDTSGNAYITGSTGSTESTFPAVVGPDLTFNGGALDAFVAKINASGTALDYCGYIGGSADEDGLGIAVDGSGNAYVTGDTDSTEASFPAYVGPDTSHNGDWDAFVAKVNASGTALDYCGYIGGADGDDGQAITVDSAGNVYVAGNTDSTETTFPVLGGPDLSHNGGTDAFVAKVNVTGTALIYCGYIGGSGEEYSQGIGIAIDKDGNAYIAGDTTSTEVTLPVKVGPDLTYNGGTNDVFVAKINATGTALVYCGFIGGAGEEYGQGISLDGAGNAHISGDTSSNEASFPVVLGPDSTYNGGATDVFAAKVSATGAHLVFCGYIGGAADEYSCGIGVNAAGDVYVAGTTSSSQATFPVAGGPDLTQNGGYDVFVGKIRIVRKDDFLATWDGQGVYYKSSDTGAWVKLASPATMITCGDFDDDGIDDLAGLWPSQGGIWVKYSKTGAWARLSSTARYIATGDMNGDGRVDLLGTWDGQGVYYRNSVNGIWVKLASEATMIACGDLDGDSIDDLIGLWPSQGGIWVKYSHNNAWAQISSTARHISAGDMNGDGRDDLLGTWDGQGAFYRDSITGAWVKMASPATLITTGDLDGDGTDDLIGIWPTQGGVWVKYSQTGAWALLGSTARDISAGKMRPAGTSAPPQAVMELALPMGGVESGPEGAVSPKDFSSRGPGGRRFFYVEGKDQLPGERSSMELTRTPGPGEPLFIFAEQENLFPVETNKVRDRESRPAKPAKKAEKH
jgi:hypothetical protein